MGVLFFCLASAAQRIDGVPMRSTTSHHIRWLLAAFIAVLLFAGAFGFIWEQTSRHQDRRHPFRIGRAVDIGGRTLNIDCEGAGTPAVILESGGGGYGGYGWRTVQTQVAQSTTVCWYDRAGEGWSDPPNSPRTSATVIADLHELLHRAGVPAQYILVGHSIGGEYVRIFAARFPSEVAGIVLVDSTHPDQQEPSVMQSPINRAPALVRRVSCTAMPVITNLGIMRFFMRNTPVTLPPEFLPEGPEAARAFRQQRIKGMETEVIQGCAATQGGAIRPDRGSGNPEVDRAAKDAGSVGDLPLIVLTAGQYWNSDDLAAAKEIADFHSKWVNQFQAELAHLSVNGKQIVVQNSSHAIPTDAPESISSAIESMVSKTREHH